LSCLNEEISRNSQQLRKKAAKHHFFIIIGICNGRNMLAILFFVEVCWLVGCFTSVTRILSK